MNRLVRKLNQHYAGQADVAIVRAMLWRAMLIYLTLVLLLTLAVYVPFLIATKMWYDMFEQLGFHATCGILLLLAVPVVFASVYLFAFAKWLTSKSPPTNIKREQAPKLFQLVDEVAKNFPHIDPAEIFISADTSAEAFTDFRLSKPWTWHHRLAIGFFPVGICTTREFQAIVAHEFYHFQFTAKNWTRFIGFAQHISWDAQYYYFIWFVRPLLRKLHRGIWGRQLVLSRRSEIKADQAAAETFGPTPIAISLIRGRIWEINYEKNESVPKRWLLDNFDYRKTIFSNIYKTVSIAPVELPALYDQAMAEVASELEPHPSLQERVKLLGFDPKQFKTKALQAIEKSLPTATALKAEAALIFSILDESIPESEFKRWQAERDWLVQIHRAWIENPPPVADSEVLSHLWDRYHYFKTLNQTESAIAALEQIVEAAPENLIAPSYLATLQLGLGDTSRIQQVWDDLVGPSSNLEHNAYLALKEHFESTGDETSLYCLTGYLEEINRRSARLAVELNRPLSFRTRVRTGSNPKHRRSKLTAVLRKFSRIQRAYICKQKLKNCVATQPDIVVVRVRWNRFCTERFVKNLTTELADLKSDYRLVIDKPWSLLARKIKKLPNSLIYDWQRPTAE